MDAEMLYPRFLLAKDKHTKLIKQTYGEDGFEQQCVQGKCHYSLSRNKQIKKPDLRRMESNPVLFKDAY
jgi:hypothetical protein